MNILLILKNEVAPLSDPCGFLVTFQLDAMSFPTRSLSTHIRGTSGSGAQPSTSSQSPALIARIEEKKLELENLKELRDLSAAVANQMEALQQRLSTLSDGTEGRKRQ